MSFLRRHRYALVAAAVALAAGGCGGTTDTGAGDSSAASIVPARAMAFVAVDTDMSSAQWQAVERLANMFPDKDLALERLRAEWRKNGIDWDGDVRPALGSEVDIAVLDFAKGPNVVGLVKPGDDDAFARIVKKVNAKAATPSDRIYTREVEGWQVVADAPAKLDRFEELRKDSARLTDDGTFKAALAAGPDDALVRAYLSGAPAMAAAHRFGGPQAAQLDRLGTLDWVLLTARAEDAGLRVSGIVHGTASKALRGRASGLFTPHLPEHVPGDVVAYYTFRGSDSALQQLDLGAGLPAAGVGLLTTPIKQIAPLLRGENAIYVRAGKPFPEVTLVAEPGTRVAPTRILDRALARFRSFLPSQPRAVQIAGRPGRVLRLGAISVYYVTIAGRLLVSDSRQGIAAFAGSGPKLSADPAFRSGLAAAGVGDQTLGYLFVDGRRTVDLAARYAGPIPLIVRRNLAPLRSLVLNMTKQPHEARATLFLEIRR
jgi:hypothetical protein